MKSEFYYRIETRTSLYGQVTITGITNDRNFDCIDFSFNLHETDNEAEFIEKWLGKVYFNQYADGNTIFMIPKRTYKQVANYPKTFK